MDFIQKKVGLELDLRTVRPGWLKGRLKFMTIENDTAWRVNLIKEISKVEDI